MSKKYNIKVSVPFRAMCSIRYKGVDIEKVANDFSKFCNQTSTRNIISFDG